MIGVSDFLTQVMQPYFFYSLTFLAIAFVWVKVFLKLNSVSAKTRSVLWLAPLAMPAVVLVVFHPQTLLSSSTPPTFPNSLPALSSGYALFWRTTPMVLSVTGWLCLAGAVAASSYLIITLLLGRKIAARAFHIVMMTADEWDPLQQKVQEISKQLSVRCPNVALTDDLRPNAFTLGFGKGTTIVFSLGILKMLNLEELAAVASHELAHVKSRDYLFRSIACSLNVLAFFNPLSYFAASEAQKERELFADERSVTLLKQPELIAKVLTKLGRVLQEFPKDRLVCRLSASLFLVSPLAKRPEILSSHPQIVHRVQCINSGLSTPAQKPRNKTATLLLIAVLICTAVVSSYSMIQVQTSFFPKNDLVFVRSSAGNESLTFNLTLSNGANLPINMSIPTSVSAALAQVNGNATPSGNETVLNYDGKFLVSNGTMAEEHTVPPETISLE